MLNSVKINNFGPLACLDWSNLGSINLVIGGNGSGKTFLLKVLYSALRTLEEYKRGNDQRTEAEILAEKLYWVFQPDKIGDLVTKGASAALSCAVQCGNEEFSYKFGKDTTKQISSLKNTVPPRSSNSIFLPAKEVLSLHPIILKSREQDKMFGFDDTYLDLARALRQPTQKGRNYAEFSQSRQYLENILGGRVEYDEASGRWQFRKNGQKFPLGVTAEGIKKIAILDTLLGNRYLDLNSIVFFDEPESALHPAAISQLLDIVTMLAKRGLQFFLASHSYFVVKKLFLIAQAQNMSVCVLSAHENDNSWIASDLKNGMPDNRIIDESIRLYEEEMELTLR
ncbi:MAG: ATP-binding protein [Fretibacterium sp.]|nr:ATP-binding protein [Fretibacterium sp.]